MIRYRLSFFLSDVVSPRFFLIFLSIMTLEPLNRRLAILAAVFALAGVALGAFALATDYWTIGKINDVTTLNDSLPLGKPVQLTGWNVCSHQTRVDSEERTFVSLRLLFRVCLNRATVDTNNAPVNSGPAHFWSVYWVWSSYLSVVSSLSSMSPEQRIVASSLHSWSSLLVYWWQLV